MTSMIQKNIVSSSLDAAITGGVGISVSISNSVLSGFDCFGDRLVSRLF